MELNGFDIILFRIIPTYQKGYYSYELKINPYELRAYVEPSLINKYSDSTIM
ncbi:Hypothetical protein HVR_LOCUS1321 [uncultured virus]|nr:Hypothetical protein HVR_LOCUS1321 [uncultured virus]